MLSKAAYYMQDHIRRNYALISDIARPNVFMARGRQHFPQGLHAIAKIFGGRLPAHVYAHRYFMEKQSDPSQPSPQLHITEESQGILKVMGGMRYMRDSSSKLDGTVVVMTDYNVTVKGRMLCVHEDDLKARQNSPGAPSPRPSSRGPGNVNVSGGSSGIGVGGGGFQGVMNASHGKHLGGTATEPPVFPSPDDDEGSSMVDQSKSYRFFHVALYPRSAPSTLHQSPHTRPSAEEGDKRNMKRAVDPDAFEPVFREKEGGYTVLYSPVEVSDKTFADLIHKLHAEERVVSTIVLPTRHAWRHVQLWADAFPDAKILSSTPIPIEEPKHTSTPVVTSSDPTTTASSASEWVGGCQDMGNGLTGLSFPEVGDEDCETTAPPLSSSSSTSSSRDDNQPFAQGAAMNHGGSGGDPLSVGGETKPFGQSTPPPSAPPPGSYAFSSSIPFTGSLGNMDREDELVDSILMSPGEMYLKQFIGLRHEDADRVQALIPKDHPSPPPAVVTLSPSLTLYYIAGDPTAEEYVLYDSQTRTLACTDLFHGEYSDLDPVNSWMCRVWFKFMKRGNHKRSDIVPRDKWLAIRHGRGGSLQKVRESVDYLTRRLPIDLLLYAHGTPPLAQDPANALRVQWGLPPLPEDKLPRSISAQE